MFYSIDSMFVSITTVVSPFYPALSPGPSMRTWAFISKRSSAKLFIGKTNSASIPPHTAFQKGVRSPWALLEPTVPHVTATPLQDVKECKLTKNPSYKDTDADSVKVAKFICPITNVETNGSSQCVAM